VRRLVPAAGSERIMWTSLTSPSSRSSSRNARQVTKAGASRLHALRGSRVAPEIVGEAVEVEQGIPGLIDRPGWRAEGHIAMDAPHEQ
jgi:hypothetical protein